MDALKLDIENMTPRQFSQAWRKATPEQQAKIKELVQALCDKHKRQMELIEELRRSILPRYKTISAINYFLKTRLIRRTTIEK